MSLDWLAQIPWQPWTVAWPLIGALAAFVVPRHDAAVGIATSLLTTVSVSGVLIQVAVGGPLEYHIGGWEAPLGIGLFTDGFSALMLAVTAVVGTAIGVYARAYFQKGAEKVRQFWALWLFLWAALNALFQAADLFNLYVTLELLGLSAVALVSLRGTQHALWGAMRYLLVSLSGSMAYLVGVVLVYHDHATLDLGMLAGRMDTGAVSTIALGAMLTGLLLKTGLFPFHVWLPPAHGAARSPVSALLSGLVVKGSFYVVVRLWLTFAPEGQGLPLLLGALGSAAIFWGSIQALRQHRLKLLVAYSTVAQLGYLFLAFPLAALTPGLAWGGSIYLAISHAFAKSAMFLAAGSVMTHIGHDDIEGLDREVDRMPLTLTAFALAGISLAGLPPSGGFIGKWMLLQAAMSQGAWFWAVVLIAGGLLTAAYVFRVLGSAFTESSHERAAHDLPRTMQWTALALALGAVSLGFLAPWVLPLLGASP